MDYGEQQHASQTRENQVLALMRAFADDASIQVWGARAFSKVMRRHIPPKAYVSYPAWGEACTTLVSALTRHTLDAAVQAAVCTAVLSLACSGSENRRRLRAAGVATALVAAMEVHAGDAHVQSAACRAIRALAYGSDTADSARDMQHYDGAYELVAAGAVEVLVSALHTHAHHTDAQTLALHVLRFLGASNAADAAQRLRDARAAEATIAAMRMHPAHPALQRAGAEVIASLADCDESGGTTLQLLNAGAAAALAQLLMSMPAEDPYFAEAPLTAVVAMARRSGGGGATRLITAGTVEAIVAAIDNISCMDNDDPDRMTAVCLDPWQQRRCYETMLALAVTAIAELAENAPASHDMLCSAGAFRMARDALQGFRDDSVTSAALRALSAWERE
eukprot:TRINITY_DN4270_c0_g1_i1.p1 TRINITY_DN4270_c0_g1~~TRINITY_DN4270_c0_g1_i1.p1  ORF type:complete len:393 (+),score=75.60 TRINITY_DN4270_c0_g1_i1:215-1393(+)